MCSLALCFWLIASLSIVLASWVFLIVSFSYESVNQISQSNICQLRTYLYELWCAVVGTTMRTAMLHPLYSQSGGSEKARLSSNTVYFFLHLHVSFIRVDRTAVFALFLLRCLNQILQALTYPSPCSLACKKAVCAFMSFRMLDMLLSFASLLPPRLVSSRLTLAFHQIRLRGQARDMS